MWPREEPQVSSLRTRDGEEKAEPRQGWNSWGWSSDSGWQAAVEADPDGPTGYIGPPGLTVHVNTKERGKFWGETPEKALRKPQGLNENGWSSNDRVCCGVGVYPRQSQCFPKIWWQFGAHDLGARANWEEAICQGSWWSLSLVALLGLRGLAYRAKALPCLGRNHWLQHLQTRLVSDGDGVTNSWWLLPSHPTWQFRVKCSHLALGGCFKKPHCKVLSPWW